MTRFLAAILGLAVALGAGAAQAQTLLGGGGGGGGGTGCVPSGASGHLLLDNGSGACTTDAHASASNGALSLGASGTPGSIIIGNATSGTITIQAPTGALGTVTLSVPDATDTLVGRATTDTLTNKTLTSPTINGGALSGTLSGTPTLSGNLTFSGVPLMTGLSGGTVVSYVGLDSGNDLVLGTPAGSGNALFGTTTGNVANDIVTMANTTVGVKDGGITYGLTGDSVLLETTSGGLVTASTLPLATSSVRGAVIPDGTIITVSGGDITVAKSSSSGFGVAEVDNSTITASGGVISAVNVGTVTHGTITSGDFCLGGTSPQISCSTAPGTGVITALGQNVTGSGGIVLVTSPTLVTPTLGAATATSVNGLTITTSTGTLTIANSKTLTDTSGVGADLLLGATGGGFAAYGGASSAGSVLTALSAAGAGSFLAYTNADTASTLVERDGSGNFSAGTITANLIGGASLDLPLAGGTLTGELTTETSATANAPINIPPGSAPTSPANGDLWTTSAGVFARVAGSTVGPFGSSGTGCTSSGSDILLGNGSGGCTNYAGTSASGEILLSLNAAGVGTFSATPTLGASGTLGSVTMGNATSGTLTLEPAAGAITGTVLIPSGSDTLVNLTGTQTLTGKSIAGSEINSGTVGPTYGGTGENNGSYTITLGGNVSTAGAFSTAGAYGLTLTASNTTNATLPAGSTNIPDYAAITSGDICQGGTAPAFSCNVATTGSGSVVLATSPSIASPTITSSLTATGLVTLGDIATQATNTVLVNATSGSASPTAQSVSTCSAAADALNWTTNTGFGCNTSITASAAPLSGITGFGTGVASALADNVGSAGAPVVFNGALGTPSSGSAANLTAATSSTLGPVKPDGATISNSSGAISLNLANENKWTASQQVTIQTLTISTTTYTPNFDTGNDFEINTINHTTCAAGACTFANPSTTPVAGQHGVIYVVQDSTGGGSIGSTKWGTDYLFAGGTAPTLSTGANAIDAISYAVLSSTQIICTVAALNVSNP